MTLRELRRCLWKIKVPEDMYRLSGGLPSDEMCICQEDGKWIVYYSERGVRSDLKCFDTEDEACRYFYNELKKYGTANTEVDQS